MQSGILYFPLVHDMEMISQQDKLQEQYLEKYPLLQIIRYKYCKRK